jgi:cell division protein ZapB
LTTIHATSIVGALEKNLAMNEDRFHSLSAKVDDLIDLCSTLKTENQLLRATADNWQVERRQLLSQNKEAKAKLESVVTRLKSINET